MLVQTRRLKKNILVSQRILSKFLLGRYNAHGTLTKDGDEVKIGGYPSVYIFPELLSDNLEL